MDKKFLDENGNFQFHFGKAEKVFQFDEISHCIPAMQQNVDFVIISNKVIFLEFKSTEVSNINNKEAFEKKIKQERQKFFETIAKKFVSSLFWLWATDECDREKEIEYYFLIDSELIDAKMRKKFRNKIAKQLPHGYENYSIIKRPILTRFFICDMEEWKEYFPEYAITRIEA